MSRELNVDPAAATRAGQALADTGDFLIWGRRNHGGRIEAAHAAAPWGDDELGRAFANGKGDDAGYLASALMLLKGWQAAAERTEEMGRQIMRAAIEVDQVDLMSAHRMDRFTESA